MIQRPLVHIGMAKAASTFLQLEVFPNAEGLLNLGKHHIPADLRAAGSALTRRTSADWNLAKFRQPFDTALTEAARKGLRPVLSDEDLSVYKFQDPELMARRLRDILGPYDVLLLIREPASWIRSHYLFRLEHQNPVAALGFDHWLRSHLEARRIGSDVLEIWFSALALTYRSISGGAVYILPYELMRTDKPRFASELSAILGTPKEPLQALLEAPPNAAAHKLRITAAQQEFYELFRWVILEQPARAEAEVRAALPSLGARPLPPLLDRKLVDLAAAAGVDRKSWSEVFRALARLLPSDGPMATPVIPNDVQKQLCSVARQQLGAPRREFGLDLANYRLNYLES